MGTTPGWLFDVNPYTDEGQFLQRVSTICKLSRRDQDEVFRLAEALQRRAGEDRLMESQAVRTSRL